MFIDNLANVKVEASYNDQFVLSCEHEGFRYHIWCHNKPPYAAVDGLICAIYKNSIPPDNKAHRKLYSHTKFGEALVHAMRREASIMHLFDNALLDAAKKKEQERQEQQIARIASHKRAAGEQLYDALAGMIDAYWIGSENSDDVHAPECVRAALAAIAAAQPTENC